MPVVGLLGATPQQRWLTVTAALLSAVLFSAVTVTADATSVFQGASLPQVLLVLIAGITFAFSQSAELQPQNDIPVGSGTKPTRFSGISLLCLGWLWLIVSTLHATWYANGRAAWNGFWHVTALAVFAWLMRQLSGKPGVDRALAGMLIAGSIILSVHALHQRFVSMPQTRAQYEADPDGVLMQLQLDAPPGSPTRQQYENRLYSSEPVASFALTNSLAIVLTGSLTVTLLLVVSQLLNPARSTRQLVLLALVSGLVGWAWLLTKSRSAYAALILVLLGSLLTFGVAYYVGRRRRDTAPEATLAPPGLPAAARLKLAAILLAIVGSLFAALLYSLASDRLILNEAPKSLLYRLEYWQATSKMILTYGWTGVGLGNFQSYYPQFKLPAASEIIADPHNIFLDLAANCSVPFLLIICIACSSLLAGSAARLLQQPLPLKSPTGELKTDRIGQTQDHAKPMVRWIWLGGICGLIGAILLQLLLREAVDAVASLLGATLAAVVVPFVIPSPEQNARRLRSVALAAVAAMFICLMTTGSWQASGIAFPLLAWLALATPAEKPCVIRDRRVIVALRAGLALLLIAFVMQTWRPVHSSWAAAQSALAAIGAKDWNTADQLAQDSQAADRLDPTAYRLLVQIRVEQAAAQLPDQFSSAAAAVQQAIDRLLACDPAGPGNWSFAAEQMLSLASLAQGIKSSPQLTGSEREARRASGQAASAQPLSDSARALVERAVDYGQQAVLRYPSSVALHVQRGVGLALLGKHNEAREELEQAVQLSAKTPHVDRQLGSQQIWLPADLNVFPTEAVIRPTTGSSWVQAEPLCEYLRTNF